MAQISAKEVMALRQKTGLSMMECKKALTETGGDPVAAEESLRKKMKGKMDTRTDRAAGEGLILVKVDGNAGVIVELRAETDFTAKNENFAAAAGTIAEMAMKAGSGDVEPTDEMKAVMDDVRISTGENASIARVAKLEGGEGTTFGTYVHHDGKTGVLLQLSGGVPDEVAKDICMHITAALPRPEGVSRDDIPAEVIEKERKLAMEQAVEEGKNEEIAAKIVEGKVNKLYKDLALLEQPFVKDDKQQVKNLLPSGGDVVAFRRWAVGETA